VTGDARLIEIACWAHCRRKLLEVHAATGSASAHETLERMARLFKIEADINAHDPGQRHAARQERSLPLLADLKGLSHSRLRHHQPQELARRRDPL
jgi:transposase